MVAVIDSDQHLFESRSLWSEHIDPSQRHQALTIVDDELGYSWLTWRDKRLSLVQGHNVVYCQHIIEGFAGKTPLGHHATLAVPEKEGSLRVSVSPFRLGMTNPVLFSDPAS